MVSSEVHLVPVMPPVCLVPVVSHDNPGACRYKNPLFMCPCILPFLELATVFSCNNTLQQMDRHPISIPRLPWLQPRLRAVLFHGISHGYM